MGALVRFETVGAGAALDSALRSELLTTWVAATDAGGSVGFVAPADETVVARVLDATLCRVADGHDALGVLRDPVGRAVGMGVLAGRGSELCRHWRTVLRVMVHPESQGAGAGRVLMEGLHDLGRDLGLEHLQLTVRDGQGLTDFYARFGYRVVGRHPGAVRVAEGDDRDEIMMVANLAG